MAESTSIGNSLLTEHLRWTPLVRFHSVSDRNALDPANRVLFLITRSR